MKRGYSFTIFFFDTFSVIRKSGHKKRVTATGSLQLTCKATLSFMKGQLYIISFKQEWNNKNAADTCDTNNSQQ